MTRHRNRAAELLDTLERLLPQLETYCADEELRGQLEELEAENIRLKNHVMGQDRIIAEMKGEGAA